MSNAHAWRITRRSIGITSPLALAGAALVAVISPDSPLAITIVVGIFVFALCYVLARVTDDIKARLDAAQEEARNHREQMARQLHGAICHEALGWIGAHKDLVERFEAAAAVLRRSYEPDTAGPPSDGLRLRAVRDFERRNERVSPAG